MKTRTWQLQHAKNRFSELVNRAAGGEPQLVTRNGRPVIYVIDVDTFNSRFAPRGKSKKNILLQRPHKDIKLDRTRDKDRGRDIDL